jgi:uncharacterized protein YjcR
MARKQRGTVILMDYASIAERIDVEPAVVRLWKSRGKMPDPDFMIAQSPGWLPETITDWIATFEDGAPARKRAS